MILASVADMSPETNAIALFLGAEPLRIIGHSPQPTVDQNGSGSILVYAGSNPETAHTRLSSLLAECHRDLAADGRMALLAENRIHTCLRSLRSLLPGASGAGGDGQHGQGVSISATLKLVRSAGFTNVAAFAVSPSAEDPAEIRPLTRRDWITPAFLVTASRSATSDSFLLERILHTIDQTQSGGQKATGRILRVINSARGKSIALVAYGESRIVVRVARSTVMLEDEARSYEVLKQIAGRAVVAGKVPHPLGAGAIGNVSFFVQSALGGAPLRTKIKGSNRAAYLREVDRFLRALNPHLPAVRSVSLDDELAASILGPMTQFALQHVSDTGLRAEAIALLADSLRGATIRPGIVHGDFGPANILVDGTRITGVIDWEAARALGPPILDAFNYLDSAHRACSRNMSIVDTLPLLAGSDWPIPGELEFLEEFFRYCGVDFRFQKGFALLYSLFHFGPQLRFANTDHGPKRRLEGLLRRLVT